MLPVLWLSAFVIGKFADRLLTAETHDDKATLGLSV